MSEPQTSPVRRGDTVNVQRCLLSTLGRPDVKIKLLESNSLWIFVAAFFQALSTFFFQIPSAYGLNGPVLSSSYGMYHNASFGMDTLYSLMEN